MQPYLLELYGNSTAYSIAGLAAAIVAGAQIAGGLLVPYVSRVFGRRTTVILVCHMISVVVLAVIGLVPNFWVAVILLVLWGLMFSAVTPIRQAYLNALIPSQQRATVLSFDSMFGSTGGVVIQPVLGKAADVWGYPVSYQLCAVFQVFAIPFAWLARREHAKADAID
jgi:MFS family permease